jgi:hypothetical protein
MTEQDYDAKGRRIAQYFFEELEKIAFSPVAKKMLETAAKSQGEAVALGKSLGWKKWIPFTGGHRAWWAARGGARQLAGEAEARAAKEQALLYKQIAKNAKNPDRVAALRKRIEAGPQGLGVVQRGIRSAKRGVGADAPVPTGTPEPTALQKYGPRAALYAGLPVAGAAALYTGQKYVQSQQQDPYGYGG